MFFQSLNNDVILECIDKIHIDAKFKGLSARVFKSCEKRDRIFPGVPSADKTWIDASLAGDASPGFQLILSEAINSREGSDQIIVLLKISLSKAKLKARSKVSRQKNKF